MYKILLSFKVRFAINQYNRDLEVLYGMADGEQSSGDAHKSAKEVFIYDYNASEYPLINRDINCFLGISWGCDWGYHENGVYWEECYCAEDSCNHSSTLKVEFLHVIVMILSVGFMTFKTLVAFI